MGSSGRSQRVTGLNGPKVFYPLDGRRPDPSSDPSSGPRPDFPLLPIGVCQEVNTDNPKIFVANRSGSLLVNRSFVLDML